GITSRHLKMNALYEFKIFSNLSSFGGQAKTVSEIVFEISKNKR
ncbi:35301_t:CDS:1, partial [Gigaspora margarita]